MSRTALVVTTINAPTTAMVALAEGAQQRGIEFIVIGDRKSPPVFALPHARYFDLHAQTATDLELARKIPTGHYARKNIGYLHAILAGAEVIIETDDDNVPLESFWSERRRLTRARSTEPGSTGWSNVYRYFSDALIWPRGLPLDEVNTRLHALEPLRELDCPIQQGLANGNPDVDAVYRLLLPIPINFEAASPVALSSGVWCPFNSQNTTWWRSAFPLLYLPFYCSFRMTDIWRSFVAQRIAWANGWSILFHAATVRQDRNEHDLMRDFGDEVPGYLHNRRIARCLDQLDLASGEAAIPENLLHCYRMLVTEGWIGKEELPLLDAWLSDITRLM